MATSTEDILERTRRLGEAASRDLETRTYPVGETGAAQIVANIVQFIERENLRGASDRVRLDPRLRGAYEDYAITFMAVLKRFPNGEVPVLKTQANEYREAIPIDAANRRAGETAEALARQSSSEAPVQDLPNSSRFTLEYWNALARDGAPVGTQDWRTATTTFFGLLSANLWRAMLGHAHRTSNHISYTVDCTNHGYVLDYWPQFFFSPKQFGAKATRPVTHALKPNHYRFQGWLNGQVTQDPGVHQAGPSHTQTTLRAF